MVPTHFLTALASRQQMRCGQCSSLLWNSLAAGICFSPVTRPSAGSARRGRCSLSSGPSPRMGAQVSDDDAGCPRLYCSTSHTAGLHRRRCRCRRLLLLVCDGLFVLAGSAGRDGLFRPQVDLAMLSSAAMMIGHCPSSFTNVASRMRVSRSQPTVRACVCALRCGLQSDCW
jgi:hypothetical protein